MSEKQNRRPRVAVVGSINMDLLVRTPALPRPGETVIGHDVTEVPGGKGANQAVAAARLGADVRMVARIGDDAFGSTLREGLRSNGVDTRAVLSTPQCASGLAMVNVDDTGENSIIAIPGANGRVTPEDVKQHSDVITNADVLLVQFEIPLESVVASINIARESGIPIVLDPAPIKADLPDDVFAVEFACPNETETEALTGIDIGDASITSLAAAAERLHELGVQTPIITLGSKGALVRNGNGKVEVFRASRVNAVDSTAAGDAFAGSLAFGVASGFGRDEAIRLAIQAGSYAATKLGAQPSMPTIADLTQFDSGK